MIIYIFILFLFWREERGKNGWIEQLQIFISLADK